MSSDTQSIKQRWKGTNTHTHLPEVSTEEEKWLRAMFDHWVLANTGATAKQLHVPDPDSDIIEPLCGTKNVEWQQKSFAVYPIGHKPICSRCASGVWSDE